MAKQTVWDIRKLKDRKLHVLLKMVISFYLHYINTFMISIYDIRTFSFSGQVPALSRPEKQGSSVYSCT